MSEAIRTKPRKKGKSKVKQKEVACVESCEDALIQVIEPTPVTSAINNVSHSTENCPNGTSVDNVKITTEENVNCTDESGIVLHQLQNLLVEEPQLNEPSTVQANAVSDSMKITKTDENEVVQPSDANPVPQEQEQILVSAPSAPNESLAYTKVQVTWDQLLDLPNDPDMKNAEKTAYPLTFQDSVGFFFRENQAQDSLLKPFSEAQMTSFYENKLLESEEAIQQSFLNCQKDLENHQLYENLSSYLRSRLALTSALEDIAQLNKDTEQLLDQLWTKSTQKASALGECSDGKHVRAHEEFILAHFNQKASGNLARNLKQRREKLQDKISLHLYQSTLYKLQIDSFISDVDRRQSHVSISILFAFLRRPIKDRPFLSQLRHWLNYVVVELFKQASKEDFLFLAHHMLRCPAGSVRWTRPYMQTPYYNAYSQEDNIHRTDVALSLLSLVCQAVDHRDDFLKSWMCDEDPINHWVWLDSDGDDEEGADSSDVPVGVSAVLHLSDNDLLALINQIPIADIYRNMFGIVERDGRDVLDGPTETHDWLRIFAQSVRLLRILKSALETYGTARYKNFTKRIGQVVLHVICNLCDYWEFYRQKQEQRYFNGLEESPMKERLVLEYENVVLQGLSILIQGRQQRLWHFLSMVPFARLTSRIKFTFWLRLHGEIDGKVDETTVQSPGFWTSFISKLILLPEPDLFVFLVTLSSLVNSSVTPGDSLLQLVTWELSELGLVDDSSRDICFKTAKELLIDLICQCPSLVSFLIQRLDVWLRTTRNGKAALHFFNDFPLHRWQPIGQDLQLLRDWILNHPLQSVQHHLSITLLTSLNWELDDRQMRPFLGRWMHHGTALLLVEVMKKYGRVNVPGISGSVFMPTLLLDSVQYMSSFLRSWSTSQLVQWAWRLVLKLRLHILDLYPTYVPWIIDHGLHKALSKVPRLQDDGDMKVLADGIAAGDAFSAFVALSMTDVGHVVPKFCTEGVELLAQLASAQCHRQIVFLLDVMFPLFIHCPDVLYAPKTISVMQSIIQADSTYYKMAKNLLVQQFPGTILRLLASFVENSVGNFVKWNLRGPWTLIEIWLNFLTRLPKWNMDKNVIYLLDVLVRLSFEDPAALSIVKRTLMNRLREPPVYRPPKGLASRVGSWVSGTSDASGSVDIEPLELLSLNPAFPYLSWIILDLEMERQRPIWAAAKWELQPGKHKTVEQALKAAAVVAKMNPLSSSSQLCLVRYAQIAASDLSTQHALFPLVLQRFFALYFGRPDLINVESWAAGERIFKSNSSHSTLIKNLNRRLAECADRHHETVAFSSFYQAACLWLKDIKLLEPNVYLPTLSPVYSAERLVSAFQGDEALWMDLYDLDGSIRAERQQLREALLTERNELLPKMAPVNQSRVNSGVMVGPDCLLVRLKSYEEPALLNTKIQVIAPFSRPSVTTLRKTSELQRMLQPRIGVILQNVEQYNRRVAELTALDCHFVELQADKFGSFPVEKTIAVKCSGTQTGSCSGAALVRLSYAQWKVNESVCRQLDSNRQDCQRLCGWFENPPNVELLCQSALYLEHCSEEICRLADSKAEFLESGAALFYMLVGLLGEETNAYLPTKQLLSTCIEVLGQQCIAGHPQQCRNLIGLLSSNANLAGVLAPHFTPSTTSPSTDSIEAFLDCYELITTLSKNECDLIFVLLTKFDLRWWLKCSQTQPADRSRLLSVIGAALEKYGLEPKAKSLAVHEVLRRHWQQIFIDNFPEQYPTVLQLLIKSSESQSCSLVLWCDLINTLGQGLLRFRPDSNVQDFRPQVLQYTTQQTLLGIQQLMETATLFSQHFSRERQLHGLYGLYPKYRPYIDAIASFLMMLGHTLCFATLQNDVGTRSDVLVNRLWLVIRDLYSPWLLPYTQQQVNADCAAWIQQLSSDRKLLLPWIAADSSLAASMVASLTSCVSFLHETIPSQQQSALSHVLAFYLQGYCHSGMKPHIYHVLHEGLQSLPWHTLTPSLTDLEQVVRVTGQFLPEVHAFLVSVVVRWPFKCLLDMWCHQQTGCSRILSCLLHLYVRLAVEPTAKQNGTMRRILEEACSFPWNYIDGSVYDQVLNWYVSTCDPLFVIQSHTKQAPNSQMNTSNDALIFRLLQAASGYSISQSTTNVPKHADGLLKRQMFVKSWIRLISLTVSRYRSAVEQHPKAVGCAVGDLLQFVTTQANGSTTEMSVVLHEYLQVTCSSSPIGDELQIGLCRWIASSMSGPLIEAVLRVILNQSGHLDRLALVMESALEHYDGMWSDAMNIMGLSSTKEPHLLKELMVASTKQSCILTWYVLMRTRHPPPLADYDVPEVLEHLLSGCKLLALSETIEPKLVLVYERLMLALDAASAAKEEKEKLWLRLTPLRNEWCTLLSAWAEDSKGWLSSIGLGKAPSLSSKGRCLARIIRCFLVIEANSDSKKQWQAECEQLDKLATNRSYADCKPLIENASEFFKNGTEDYNSRGIRLLQQMAPLLYCRRYLSHLLA